MAQGELSGGYVFYVKDRRLVFDVNDLGKHTVLTSGTELPPGATILRYAFKVTGDCQGTGTLYVDERKVGEGGLRTSKARISWEGLDIGRDGLSPVSSDYAGRVDFAFTPGVLRKVVIEVEEAPPAEPPARAGAVPQATPTAR